MMVQRVVGRSGAKCELVGTSAGCGKKVKDSWVILDAGKCSGAKHFETSAVKFCNDGRHTPETCKLRC
jgi:hypothetical protein